MEGYLGLFFSALLSASILPFSSEVVLVGLIATENYNSTILWGMATFGNVAGACINWWLGRFCLNWRDRNWFPVSQKQLDTAESWFLRYGVWSLLFSWLPIVGDPLTFLAGILRVNFGLFIILVTIGKAGRYGILVLLAKGIIGI
jgi:membrane protein YqaA with SNARE-associated domain|tara:strand:+ start:703 stop:1137 length:435 start_codon:yes stop_codon:yes gene_type:complete